MWNVECGRRNVGGRGVGSVEGEFGGAGLVDDGDAGGIELWGVVENVAAGTLADGDDMGGLADGLTELPGVDLRVYPMVIFGVAEEDEVVDGDHTGYAALTDADGQFAGKAVVELDAVAP